MHEHDIFEKKGEALQSEFSSGFLTAQYRGNHLR